MRRFLEGRGRQLQSARGLPRGGGPSQFICCECNSILLEGELRRGSAWSKRCRRGHLVIRLRPAFLDFLRGLAWGSLVILGAAIATLYFDTARSAILAAAGAICSALACKRLLDGMHYLKLTDPARQVARLHFSEALGAWVAILLSTFVVSR